MKKYNLFVILILISFSIVAQNPFARFNYIPPTVTSSKGEFEEFHDQKDIVEIGSIKYNVRTKKIVGFIDEQKLRNEISVITPAMSIDPLCKSYSSLNYSTNIHNPNLTCT